MKDGLILLIEDVNVQSVLMSKVIFLEILSVICNDT